MKILLCLVVLLLFLAAATSVHAATNVTATRELPDTVKACDQFTVTVTIDNVELMGQVVEVVPAGFRAYYRAENLHGLEGVLVTSDTYPTITYYYLASPGVSQASFTYRLVAGTVAPVAPGDYYFTGHVTSMGFNVTETAGDTKITVLCTDYPEYDTNGDCALCSNEVLLAIADYYAGIIDLATVRAVIAEYGGGHVNGRV